MESKDFRPKGKSLKPLRALAPFLWRYRGTLLLALIALVVASAAMLALPVALKYLIDYGWASWAQRCCSVCLQRCATTW